MGLNTYFSSTKFAVYNGVNDDRKMLGVVTLKVMRICSSYDFHFNSSGDCNTAVIV